MSAADRVQRRADLLDRYRGPAALAIAAVLTIAFDRFVFIDTGDHIIRSAYSTLVLVFATIWLVTYLALAFLAAHFEREAVVLRRARPGLPRAEVVVTADPE